VIPPKNLALVSWAGLRERQDSRLAAGRPAGDSFPPVDALPGDPARDVGPDLHTTSPPWPGGARNNAALERFQFVYFERQQAVGAEREPGRLSRSDLEARSFPDADEAMAAAGENVSRPRPYSRSSAGTVRNGCGRRSSRLRTGSGSQDVAIKARFAMAERHICGILLVRFPAAGASALTPGVSPGASGGWTCTPARSLPDRPAGLMITTQ
jgi:hypothetical protein